LTHAPRFGKPEDDQTADGRPKVPSFHASLHPRYIGWFAAHAVSGWSKSTATPQSDVKK